MPQDGVVSHRNVDHCELSVELLEWPFLRAELDGQNDGALGRHPTGM